MKRSEKLFLAINEIDDKIIDEAKVKEEKPVRVQLEKRTPIKEIIAFAACFAVLAVGIFALVKFKLGSEIEPLPIDSDSSDQSFVSDPEINLTFTERDRELQTLLKELVPSAEDIDEMFNMNAVGEKYTFKIGEYYQNDYYLIPKDLRTVNGLFAIPQSYSEMEQLITKHFSAQAAEFYMNNVCHGIMTPNADGTYTVEIDSEGVPGNGIFEINGGMYFDPWEGEYRGLGIDCETARVTRRTDKIIEFTYWGYNYYAYSDGDVYSERNGVLVNEDGTWKLHYFYNYGFIPEIPAEYTEQDLELQKILETLKLGDKITALFLPDITSIGTTYNFVFPESSIPGFGCGYIDVSEPGQRIDFPKSHDDFEQRLLEYFTREATDRYMDNVCKGTMTENADGTYSVILDKAVEHPAYIEINGRMFYRAGAGGGTDSHYYDTAKVIEQTNDIIIFSYTSSYIDSFERVYEKLVYERGGWKRDPFYKPADPDADNKELQAILKDLTANAADIDGIFTRLSNQGEKYPLKVNDTDYSGAYYPIAENRKTEPSGLYTVPQTRSGLKQLLLTCFTSRAVEYYMDDIGTGHVITDTDGTHALNEDYDGGGQNTFIEADGLLYRMSWKVYDQLDIDYTTAKVISKTDKTIKFSYSGKNNTSNKTDGVIVLENGSWKLDFFHGKFIPAMPTEFIGEDLKLQNILNELSPGESLCSLFHNGMSTSNKYEFYLPGFNFSLNYYLPEEGQNPYPQTRDEMEQLLLTYFTKEKADIYINMVCKGTMTENPDGTYSITLDKENMSPMFIEIDGKMYVRMSERGGIVSGIWDTAKVIEKNDSYIRFSYVVYGMGDYCSSEGLIKYERGGWRLNMETHGGFDLEV